MAELEPGTRKDDDLEAIREILGELQLTAEYLTEETDDVFEEVLIEMYGEF